MRLIAWNRSCRTIQRVYRGHAARRRVRLIRSTESEMEMLLRRMTTQSRAYCIQALLKSKNKSFQVDTRDPQVIRAVVKVQAFIRMALARLKYLRMLGSQRESTVLLVKEAWETLVKPDFDRNAVKLVRKLIHENPALLDMCPFAEDAEKTSVVTTYAGKSEQTFDTEFVPLFRETFVASARNRVLFKLRMITGPTEADKFCRLRIFNNKTGEALPNAGGQPLAAWFDAHAAGYTLVGEAIMDEFKPVSEWQLMQTSSGDPLESRLLPIQDPM